MDEDLWGGALLMSNSRSLLCGCSSGEQPTVLSKGLIYYVHSMENVVHKPA